MDKFLEILFGRGILIEIIGAAMGNMGLGKRETFPEGRYAWGDGRIDINPDHVLNPNNGNPFEFGVSRGGFTIHGGSEPGSAGCIDLCNGYGFFKYMISRYSGNSNNVYLRVKYNSAKPINSPF